MKQNRITSADIVPDSYNDCFIPPSDPIHILKAASALGGLGGQERLHEYNSSLKMPVVSSNNGKIQREQNIRPGTEEWFKLWFTRNK
jgi:hypothetical protein